MIGPSPPRLVIPSASASPRGQSPNAQTGRPSMWTPSALRKMTRLYLYTDLTLPQIIRVVHHCESSGQVPGKDSANKKLNAMFDQQPRWLRPSSDSMADRLEALATSPTRTSPGPIRVPSRPHSASDPGSYVPLTGPALNHVADSGSSPSPFALSPASALSLTPDLAGREFSSQDFAYSPSGSSIEEQLPHNDFRDELQRRRGGDETLMSFVRKTTFMSCSTDHTTGSFQRMLGDRSLPYVQAVRRLVKRFTLPHDGGSYCSKGALGGRVSSGWVDEEDCPTPMGCEPGPLPGDFVSLNLHAATLDCEPLSDTHKRRLCYCRARASLPVSPWLMPNGVTPRAQRIHLVGPQTDDIHTTDSFGNTILHYLASNGTSKLLCGLIASGQTDRLLKNRNTAGQAFFHLVGAQMLVDLDLDGFLGLLDAKGINLAAKDHYGRTIFHMLLLRGIPQQNIQMLMHRYGRAECNTRDAFGAVPVLLSSTTSSHTYAQDSSMDLAGSEGPVAHFASVTCEQEQDRFPETQAIEDIRHSENMPSFEDGNGSNGLHSLASATLSIRHVVDRNNLLHTIPERARRGERSPVQQLDSSTSRMQLRLELTEMLLDAGVDPNHYDKRGNTPLMAFAAELPEDDDYKLGPNILHVLVDGGASINARNRAGETALHVAVRCGRKLAVRTLVKLGANIHARDADGRSVLEVADVKVRGTAESDAKGYAHFEACRAWLSGNGAVQEPTILQEWGSS